MKDINEIRFKEDLKTLKKAYAGTSYLHRLAKKMLTLLHDKYEELNGGIHWINFEKCDNKIIEISLMANIRVSEKIREIADHADSLAGNKYQMIAYENCGGEWYKITFQKKQK